LLSSRPFGEEIDEMVVFGRMIRHALPSRA